LTARPSNMSSCSSPVTSTTLPTRTPSALTTFQPFSICNHETGSVTPERLLTEARKLQRPRGPKLAICSPDGPWSAANPARRARSARSSSSASGGAILDVEFRTLVKFAACPQRVNGLQLHERRTARVIRMRGGLPAARGYPLPRAIHVVDGRSMTCCDATQVVLRRMRKARTSS